jgi:hypothetical protein
MKEQTNIFRVLVKTLLNAGIITDRTRPSTPCTSTSTKLRGEGDKMVGDEIAEEGIKFLQEINFAERAKAIRSPRSRSRPAGGSGRASDGPDLTAWRAAPTPDMPRQS